MGDLWAVLTPILASVALAVGSYIVSWLRSRKTRREIASIKQAIEGADGSLYVECGNCSQRVYLRGANILVDEQETERNELKKLSVDELVEKVMSLKSANAQAETETKLTENSSERSSRVDWVLNGGKTQV